MNGWAWCVITAIAVSSLVMVGSVGKPRDPLTGSVAVITLVVNAVLVFCIVRAVSA